MVVLAVNIVKGCNPNCFMWIIFKPSDNLMSQELRQQPRFVEKKTETQQGQCLVQNLAGAEG